MRNNVEFIASNEYAMLFEELEEFKMALYKYSDKHDKIDALCDIIVVATGAICKLGYDPNKAMAETLKEINSRKQDSTQKDIWDKWGASGKWEKWKEQPAETLYEADYEKAKIDPR